jgi:dihydrofolate reductase
MVRHTSERIGANIMGRRMFEAGERGWPEEAPFHTPVFVLTHNTRESWVRPGGTTFHFVTDGPQSALAQAKVAAGCKDVRIAGGADVVQQYLKLGAVEELEIALAPVLFGGGRRLFENLGDGLRSFQIDRVLHTPLATHRRPSSRASMPAVRQERPTQASTACHASGMCEPLLNDRLRSELCSMGVNQAQVARRKYEPEPRCG